MPLRTHHTTCREPPHCRVGVFLKSKKTPCKDSPIQVHAVAAGQQGAPQADEDVRPILQPQDENGVQRVGAGRRRGWVGVYEGAGAVGPAAAYVGCQDDVCALTLCNTTGNSQSQTNAIEHLHHPWVHKAP